VYAVEVDRDIAAKTTATDIMASTEIEAVTIKKRDRDTDFWTDVDIKVPLVFLS